MDSQPIAKTDAQQGLAERGRRNRRSLDRRMGSFAASRAGTLNQGDFSLGGLLVSLVGAIILLFVVNLIRRRAPR